MNRIGKIAKGVVAAVILIINGLFIFRCCIADDKSLLNTLTVTDNLREAYDADANLPIWTHDTPHELSSDGYMSAYALIMIPSAEEVQVTVRYNDSIYSYNDLPDGAPFHYTLTDSVTGEVFEGVVTAEADRWIYNYRRIIFEGAVLTDANNLTVSILHGDTVVTSQLVHHADQNVVLESYKLSHTEKEALTNN